MTSNTQIIVRLVVDILSSSAVTVAVKEALNAIIPMSKFNKRTRFKIHVGSCILSSYVGCKAGDYVANEFDNIMKVIEDVKDLKQIMDKKSEEPALTPEEVDELLNQMKNDEEK